MRLEVMCRHEFDENTRLDIELNLEVRVTAIVGPSGSGKTSLLSAIAGLFRPSTARIALDGEPIQDTNARVHLPPEKRGIGMVFQPTMLFPHMTVEQNLRFGIPKQRAAHSIPFHCMTESLEISQLLKRYPEEISGGQKQRTAIGRALLSCPRLLLLDEPLTALDPQLKARTTSYIEKVATNWHIPTIIVTHDQSEVRRLADTVVRIEDGRIASVVACRTDGARLPACAPVARPGSLTIPTLRLR